MLSFKRYLYKIPGFPANLSQLHFSTLLHESIHLAELRPGFTVETLMLLRVGSGLVCREKALLEAFGQALETRNQELALRVQNAAATNEDLRSAIQQTDEESRQLQEEIEKQEVDKEAVRQAIAASTATREKLTQECIQLQAHVKTVTIKLQSQINENNQISTKIIRSKKSLNRQQRKEQQKLSLIADLEAVLSEAKFKNEKLSEDLRKATTHSRSLKTSKDKLNSQISATRSQIQTASKQCAQIEKSLTEMSNRRVTNEGNSCAICVENPLEILFRPCMHVCACAKCARKLKTCPVCCVEPTHRDKIFL